METQLSEAQRQLDDALDIIYGSAGPGKDSVISLLKDAKDKIKGARDKMQESVRKLQYNQVITKRDLEYRAVSDYEHQAYMYIMKALKQERLIKERMRDHGNGEIIIEYKMYVIDPKEEN